MSSSGYALWSVVAGEQPTTSKWNILGNNDAAFNAGVGFNDGVIVSRHMAANSVGLLNIDYSTMYERLILPPNYSAAVVSSFVLQDIPSSTITATCPSGYTVEIVFGAQYQSGSNTEHDINLWDNVAGAVLATTIATYISGGGAAQSSCYPYYHTPSGGGTVSYKLRATGNSGNFDFRGMFIKIRLLKLI